MKNHLKRLKTSCESQPQIRQSPPKIYFKKADPKHMVKNHIYIYIYIYIYAYIGMFLYNTVDKYTVETYDRNNTFPCESLDF